jgi:hypothetical protein
MIIFLTTKRFLVISGLLGALVAGDDVLSAAQDTVVVHQLVGAERKFCVPKELDIQPPSWVPENRPGTPGGFAFRGCWAVDPAAPRACGLPRMFQTAGVGPRIAHPSWRFQDMAADTFYRRVLTEEDSLFEVSDDRSIVVASNKRLWSDWYVWRKAIPLSNRTKPSFAANDELLAVCQLVKDAAIPKTYVKRDFVSCERFVVARDYSFHYSFESTKRIPTSAEITSLDKELVAAIEGWRCNK